MQNYVSSDATDALSKWFDDFFLWQHEQYWSGIEQSVGALQKSGNSNFAEVGARARRFIDGLGDRNNFESLLRLAEIAANAQQELGKARGRIELDVRSEFSKFLKIDGNLLDELAKMLAKLEDGAEEVEDSDDETDASQRSKGIREAAFDAFQQTMFTLARAKYLKRSVGPATRAGRIAAWLKDRQLGPEKLLEIGRTQDDISSLRVLMSPLSRYLNGLSARYQAFRTKRAEANKWYASTPQSARDICGSELDILLLAHLRVAAQMFSEPRIFAIADEQMPAALRSIRREYRNQILVDEVADFSCIQIAGMRALCDPGISSFMACGDFNQRLTIDGIKTDSDLAWSIGKYDGFRIDIVYRQTRQLAEFARELTIDTGRSTKGLSLPPHTNTEGVSPVLGTNLKNLRQQAIWLADRITEVQHLTRTLPSIAVLVNEERYVRPVAEELQERLIDQNVQVEACIDGKFVGNEGRVRVFNITHIKGLEFEAVFFLSIDELAEKTPHLFDRYLYVGATRAATYLGITITSENLPDRIVRLKNAFESRWSY